jgi:hypothetical protein
MLLAMQSVIPWRCGAGWDWRPWTAAGAGRSVATGRTPWRPHEIIVTNLDELTERKKRKRKENWFGLTIDFLPIPEEARNVEGAVRSRENEGQRERRNGIDNVRHLDRVPHRRCLERARPRPPSLCFLLFGAILPLVLRFPFPFRNVIVIRRGARGAVPGVAASRGVPETLRFDGNGFKAVPHAVEHESNTGRRGKPRGKVHSEQKGTKLGNGIRLLFFRGR